MANEEDNCKDKPNKVGVTPQEFINTSRFWPFALRNEIWWDGDGHCDGGGNYHGDDDSTVMTTTMMIMMMSGNHDNV